MNGGPMIGSQVAHDSGDGIGSGFIVGNAANVVQRGVVTYLVDGIIR